MTTSDAKASLELYTEMLGFYAKALEIILRHSDVSLHRGDPSNKNVQAVESCLRNIKDLNKKIHTLKDEIQ